MGLSRRAYARHRADKNLPGGSLQAVQRALSRGRIQLEVDGTIDPERADRDWVANTDLTEAPTSVLAAHSQQPAVEVVQPSPAAGRGRVQRSTPEHAPPGSPGDIASETDTLHEASRKQKVWQARHAELNFREAAKELVPAKDVTAKLRNVFHVTKTKLLTIPSRAKTDLDLNPAQVLKLERLVREALEELVAGEA